MTVNELANKTDRVQYRRGDPSRLFCNHDRQTDRDVATKHPIKLAKEKEPNNENRSGG